MEEEHDFVALASYRHQREEKSSSVARSVNTSQARPLSADVIPKAKMRAQFMQSKHGKSSASSED